MSRSKSISALLLSAAFFVVGFTPNAFSQEGDARIPFVVNVDAIVSASRGNDVVTMSVVGGVEQTMIIPAATLTSIRHGSANRQANAAHLRVDSRGNLNLNLPQSDYQNATFSLYSLNGRRVMRRNIDAATRSFSRPNVAPGVYVLTVGGASGRSFTTRLNHRGGTMNVNVSYGEISNSNLRRETAAFLTSNEEWDIRVSTACYVASVYKLAIVSGDNPRQEITLQFSENCATFTDARDQKTYRYAVMPDGKTWMTENLNFATSSGSWCYDNQTSNCNTYGRLYNWAAAMGFANSCNDSACASQIQTNHQGVCPAGWRLPNHNDWDGLVMSINSDCQPNDTHCDGVGTKLKSRDLWRSSSSAAVGTNDFDFSALPGGRRWDDNFLVIDSIGRWWTATEGGATTARHRVMRYDTDVVSSLLESKENGFSIRCVLDDGATPTTYTLTTSVNPADGGTVSPSGTSTREAGATVTITAQAADGYEFVGWTGAGVANANSATTTIVMSEDRDVTANFQLVEPIGGGEGTFTDARDGKTYRYVTIGEQTWMAENLSYNPGGTGVWCNGNDANNCNGYGRLYTWAIAMSLATPLCNFVSCAAEIQPKHQGICPDGWYLPSRADWETLETAVGGSATAARHLRSENGWIGCGPAGSDNTCISEDTYGFSALASGYYNDQNGFDRVGEWGLWWTATEHGTTASNAWSPFVDNVYPDIYWDNDTKRYGYSVRCIRD